MLQNVPHIWMGAELERHMTNLYMWYEYLRWQCQNNLGPTDETQECDASNFLVNPLLYYTNTLLILHRAHVYKIKAWAAD